MASTPLLAHTHQRIHAAPFTPQSNAAAGWSDATKRYGSTLALDRLSLELRRGQVTALLGPNGAGKTTAIRLLLGLTSPTSGDVHLFGQHPGNPIARQRVGTMLQVGRVPDTLTVREHLTLFSCYYPAPRPVDESIALAGLDDVADRRFGELSGGQRQRLLFAVALCGNPDLLVLDEPTAGMDVASRRGLWQTIQDCARRGSAVLLATHYLDEADALASRVVVLRHGGIVADDTPQQLKRTVATRELRCRTNLTAERLAALAGVTAVSAGPPYASLACSDADVALRALVAADPGAGQFEIVTPKLEDVFLSLTRDDHASPEATPWRHQ